MNEYLLQDIAEWLETESIGLTHGVTVFSGRLPDNGDQVVNAVAILLSGSATPVYVMDRDENRSVADRPRVQILTRYRETDDDPKGLRVAMAVHRAMEKLGGETIGHTRFIAVEPIQTPFYVGDDGTGDSLHSCNYSLEVEDAQ